MAFKVLTALLGFILSLQAAGLGAATLSNIIVDQFGWRTGSAKVAIFAQPQTGQGSPSTFTPGATFEIRRVSDNGLASSGAISTWNGGATHAQSGDKGWWADFSSLTTPGSYYVSLPGGSNPGAQSYPFDLKEDAYSLALKASVRSYYYQRCGTAITPANGGAWNHAACHVGTQSAARLYNGSDQGAGTARNVTGGWHDAGDYRKYVTFTFSPLWDLMTAYEWNPCAFPDNTNIPESGNGVPDILDEVKWELDWLLKMQIASGGQAGALYSGVFVTTAGSNGGSGDPSAENSVYWYSNYSSGATSTGCMAFAKAARLFAAYPAAYPGYAATLQAAANSAWAWLQANPANVTYNHTGFTNANANISADDDFRRRVTAAAELYATTGLATYKTYFDANYNNAAGAANGGTYHPITNNEFWPEAADTLQMGLVTYASTAGATAGVVTAIKAAIRNGANNRVVADQTAGTDLYRGYMWDGYYGWGSNQRKSHWGALATWAQRLNVGSPAELANYDKADEEYLHYIHGRNPLNWVYLTNMGPEGANAGAEQSVNKIYHGWFYELTNYDGLTGGHIGPAPGILAGGANGVYATDTANSGGTAVYPPAGQPIQKSYLNWNKTWPDCSWSVTENGIYYQAAYTFLVAMHAPCSGPQPTATPTPTQTNYAGTPTSTRTATATPSPSTTPTPVCQTLLNGAETLAENGTWSGTLAVRSIVASGAAPAGAVTQGSNALYANVTVSAGWNGDIANLTGFAPGVWTPYAQLKMDVHVAAGLVAGATYAELLLRADCSSCGAGLWYQPISLDGPTLVAGPQTLTWNLDFSAGTIPAGSALSKLTLVYNNDATSATGAIYIDNVRLIGACAGPTATSTPTRTYSPTFTRTASPTPSVSPSPTHSPSRTPSPSATVSSTATRTATPLANSPTISPTATPSATATPTYSLTATRTASPSASPSQTASPSPTHTATRSASPSPTPTSTFSDSPTETPYAGTPTDTPSITETFTDSPTPSATATFSASPSPSPSFSASPSITFSPTPACPGSTYMGSTNVLGINDLSGYIDGNRWNLPVGGTINAVQFLVGSGSGQVRMAIYADAAGAPGALLTQGGPVTFGTGVQSLDVAPTDLAAGIYWIFVQTTAGIQLGMANSGGQEYYQTQAFGPFPPTLSGGNYSNWALALLAVLCPLPTPTVTPTFTESDTPTQSPSASPSPTLSSSVTASPSVTHSPSPSASATATATFSVTLSSTIAIGTATATPTATRTRTATGTSSVTLTPAPPTATATPSHTSVPATASFTATLTSTPPSPLTATLTPTPPPASTGLLIIDEAVALPNPDPNALALKLQGSCDSLEARIYTPALNAVLVIKGPGGNGGWLRLDLPVGWQTGLAKGVYYAQVRAKRGSVVSKPVLVKLLVLR